MRPIWDIPGLQLYKWIEDSGLNMTGSPPAVHMFPLNVTETSVVPKQEFTDS